MYFIILSFAITVMYIFFFLSSAGFSGHELLVGLPLISSTRSILHSPFLFYLNSVVLYTVMFNQTKVLCQS